MKLRFPEILLIDDDPSFSASVCGWLSELGYRATSASTAEEGVVLLENNEFAALLLDQQLPDIHGHAVLRQLMRSGAPLPVIMMSGSADADDILRAWRANASDFLRKPFRIEDLTTALDRAMSSGPTIPPMPASAPTPVVPRAPEFTPAPSCEPDKGFAPVKDLATSAEGENAPTKSSSKQKRPQAKVGLRQMIRRMQDELRGGAAKLPILDPKVAQIQEFLRRDDYDMREVADAVGRDAALTGGVLRTANSAQYCRGTPIKSLRDACVRIGPKHVISIALEVVLQGQFIISKEPFRTITQQLWRNSVVTSRAAGLLARTLGRVDADELQIAALLQNIGEALCIRMLSERVEETDEFSLEELAKELGPVHEAFGVSLASSWRLPNSILWVIGHHHRPPRGPESNDRKIIRHIVLAAWAMALETGFTYLPRHENVSSAEFLKVLQLEPTVENELWQEIGSWDV